VSDFLALPAVRFARRHSPAGVVLRWHVVVVVVVVVVTQRFLGLL